MSMMGSAAAEATLPLMPAAHATLPHAMGSTPQVAPAVRVATIEDPARGALRAPPANDPGLRRIGSPDARPNSGPFTIAGTQSSISRVNAWLRALGQAPLGRPAAPGAVPTVRSPSHLVPRLPPGQRNPLGPNQVVNPLMRIFSPGSRMRAVQDLPQMSGSINEDRLVHIVNRALTPQRLEFFDRLQPAQKEVARALLSAAIHELEQPLQLAIDAMNSFDTVVGVILDRSSKWQDQAQRALPPLPDAATATAVLPGALEAAASLPEPAGLLPEGAIETVTVSTKHGPLTTEVYRSASMSETKIRANIRLLQDRNPLLYAGLPEEELVRTARNSDYFLITTQHGTSNLRGHQAPLIDTPQRAITAITEREFTAGQYGLHRAGRYAELTFVANSTELPGGAGQVVRQAENWARSRALDGITFYNTDTTNGQSRGFYEHMGYKLIRETRVDVKSLDARVQDQLVNAGIFTRAQIDRGEAELPRYFFSKRFDDPAPAQQR
jgi:hypothetical protein